MLSVAINLFQFRVYFRLKENHHKKFTETHTHTHTYRFKFNQKSKLKKEEEKKRRKNDIYENVTFSIPVETISFVRFLFFFI